MDIELYIADLVQEALRTNLEPTDREDLAGDVLKGLAIELWSDALGEGLWIVADEEDARKLAEPRGTVYTAAEIQRVIQIRDPTSVAEIHRWKREFNATIREYRPETVDRVAQTPAQGAVAPPPQGAAPPRTSAAAGPQLVPPPGAPPAPAPIPQPQIPVLEDSPRRLELKTEAARAESQGPVTL